ncbi:MAG: GAF domain-containing protein [Anaerolineae bacterium]|nr:GAF domain-containing protein [Anaerolineae bacterium]
MPAIFWVDVGAYALGALSAAALALTVLAIGAQRTVNRFFALFTLLQTVWASSSLIYRLMLLLATGGTLQFVGGEIEFWLHMSVTGLVFMGPIMLAFATRYTGQRSRWTDIAIIAGLAALALLITPLFQNRLILNPSLASNGMTIYDVAAPWGYASAVVPSIYFIWSTALLWRAWRRQRYAGGFYIVLGATIFLAGFVAGGVFRTYVPFPVLSITVTLSVLVLGYGIISYQLLNPLRELTAELEVKVEERTQELERTASQLEQVNQDLARRGAQLEAAAQVAREAAAIQDVQQLLNRTVHLISEHFAAYHAGIFLLDEFGKYAILQAASSEGGRRMLAKQHQLEVGKRGIVGHAAGTGKPRIALDVGQDAVYFDNPDLPNTRSEIALPLKVQEQVIGVLDVQSTAAQAFREEDIAILQTMADQVALAIRNAQLIKQAEERLIAEQRMYGEMSRQAWKNMLIGKKETCFLRNARGLSAAPDVWRPRMKQALHENKTVHDDNQAAVAVPIRVRGQTIGVIDAQKPRDQRAWTAEQTELLGKLAEQLGVALEGARLYEDAQRRAAREQMVGEIGGRLRASLDIDSILKATVRELGIALGAERVVAEVTGPAQARETAPPVTDRGDNGDADT